MTVAILTEAGSVFGYGHLSRCMALAESLGGFGADVKIYVRGDAKSAKEFEKLEWLSTDFSRLLAGADICILDSYHATLFHYQQVAKAVKFAVWIDDTKRLKYPKGIIIDGSSAPLLRSAFAKKYDIPKEKRLFLSLGGTDNKETLTKLIKLIRIKFPGYAITVSSKVDDDVLMDIDKMLLNADADSVAIEMSRCEMAISAGGQTLLELATLGVPSVAIVIADNQMQNVTRLANREHIIGFVCKKESNWENKAIRLLNKKQTEPITVKTSNIAFDILKNAKLPRFRSNLIIDGIKLKSFTNISKKEAMQILSWRNHPSIRKWMLNSDEIGEHEHFAFLKSRKIDEKSFYWLVFIDDVAIGVISIARIDWSNKIGYCGWYAKPKDAPFGCGMIFDDLCKKIGFDILGLRRLIMEVSGANTAPLKTHIYTGFAEEGRIKNYFSAQDGYSDLIFLGMDKSDK